MRPHIEYVEYSGSCGRGTFVLVEITDNCMYLTGLDRSALLTNIFHLLLPLYRNKTVQNTL